MPPNRPEDPSRGRSNPPALGRIVTVAKRSGAGGWRVERAARDSHTPHAVQTRAPKTTVELRIIK
eukprot:533772-Prorocentrum_minimum.AAC.1